MKTISLSHQIEIPILGFGVFQIPKDQTQEAVVQAIKAGYRHIDTAQIYLNETEVGLGIKQSGIPRKDLFLTTKVWVENFGYETTKASLDRSLARLDVSYLDLVLIHQPYGDSYGTWRALEEYQEKGKIRAIGVSNFSPVQTVDLGMFNKVTPQVNQIEINPFQQKEEQVKSLQAEGVAVEAWAPFAEGKNDIFHNPVLKSIGDQYGKSVAQVITRWLIERDIIVLAKSIKPERMAENIDVFDFSLTAEDKKAIARLDGTFDAIVTHDKIASLRRIAGIKAGV